MWLRGVGSIQILTNDGVTGGCWTNAGAVKNAIELSLRRAGIEVVDDYTATHILWLYVSGASDGRGGCFGLHGLRFYEFRSADLLVPGATGAVAFAPLDCSTSGVGSSMNEGVRSRAIEQSDALALRILRARDAE